MTDNQKKYIIHIIKCIKFLFITAIYGVFYTIFIIGLEQVKDNSIRSLLFALSVFHFNLIFNYFKQNHDNFFCGSSGNLIGYLGLLLSLAMFGFFQWIFIYHNFIK